MDDLRKLAVEYVNLLNSPANGLGAHVHPVHGRSDVMMRMMFRTYGQAETEKAIDTAFVYR